MNIDIKLHNEDLPDQLDLSDKIAVDCEFMGLNVERDNLCLVQITNGKNDAHIVKLNRNPYNAPNLIKVLSDSEVQKLVIACFQGCLYNNQNLTKDTFEDVEARKDFLQVLLFVGVANVQDFLPIDLGATLKMPVGTDIKDQK